MVFLDGISIKNYRCFGSEAAVLPDLGKINLIIGQNNSGKSNVLKFLVQHAKLFEEGLGLNQQPMASLKKADEPQNLEKTNFEFGIQVTPDTYSNRLVQQLDKQHGRAGVGDSFSRFLFEDRDDIWFFKTMEIDGTHGSGKCDEETFREVNKIDQRAVKQWIKQFNLTGQQATLGHAVTALMPWALLDVKVDLIPSLRSIRQINHQGLASQDGRPILNGMPHHSGAELIDELFKMQSPRIGDESDEDLLRNIEGLLEEVLGKSPVKIKVTHDKSAIRIDMDGKRLPLESLGTGIEEILIIATKASRFENQIVCIEEPELHLHPVLQRKLIRFLHEKTSNQYFIATHSAHLMDEDMCSVYHVTNDSRNSLIVPAVTAQHRSSVCRDLGYHASDILQANSIIWVEGPSDRIYLLHWISALAPKLKEGLHFSIMFYGGRLLSHLSAKDEEVTDFIDLTKLNQNSLIVMDSDRSKSGEQIGRTKQRVRREFEGAGRFCWITEGREIENYLPKNLWEEAIAEVHPTWIKRVKYGQYESVVSYTRNSKKVYVDKIKLAKSISKKNSDLGILDLTKQLNRMIKFIREANPEMILSKRQE